MAAGASVTVVGALSSRAKSIKSQPTSRHPGSSPLLILLAKSFSQRLAREQTRFSRACRTGITLISEFASSITFGDVGA
jgi:hypothetical protein